MRRGASWKKLVGEQTTCSAMSYWKMPVSRPVALSLVFLTCCICSSWANHRLPGDLVPEHYKLKILTFLPDNYTVDGKVWIQVRCLKPTKNVTLHAGPDLDISRSAVTVMDLGAKNSPETLPIATFDVRDKEDFFVIVLEKALEVNRTYGIYVPWRSEIRDALDGYYRSGYLDTKTKTKRWIGVTHFEPDGARKAFPCFDEPALKATYDIILGRKEGMATASNMPLAKSEPMRNQTGWYLDKFQRSVPMSTYLVAWLVSDLSYVTSDPSNQNNVTFRIWARGDAIAQAEYAREVGPRVLDFYERYFEVPYPLPKQDMVALPDFSAGAMENWGLITYRETALLYDRKESSFTNKKRVVEVIAHELAHQWFGNLVTMDWWNDLWLNEGFATFVAAIALDKLYPEWQTYNADSYVFLRNVFEADVLESSHPISAHVEHPRDVHERFDVVTYQKGALLIRMLSTVLGEEVLRKSIVTYLKNYAYKNAKQEDLFEVLSVNAHAHHKLPANLSVTTVMDTWTLQTGFPYINVSRDYGDDTLTVTQARYNPGNAVNGECWWIPLTYVTGTSANASTTQWLPCPKTALTLRNAPPSNVWILFNLNVAAVYRVNYDLKNWRLLSDSLRTSEETRKLIPALNKAALIDDAFSFAWNGELPYGTAFALLGYLPEEREYIPWNAALSKLSDLQDELSRQQFYGDFKAYMRKLIGPVYERLGGIAGTATTPRYDEESFRMKVASAACKSGLERCLAETRTLFDQWQSDPETNPVAPAIRSLVYTNAIRQGGEKEWNFLWQRYNASNVGAEKSKILSALAATNEFWLLRRLLEWSILGDKSGIRRQDSASVFQSVSNSQVGYYVAKTFLLENVDKISKYINSNRIGVYVKAVLKGVTNDREYSELNTFIEQNKEALAFARAAIAQGLEKARSRVKWYKRHLDEVAQALKTPN